jgi:hypothetical protein
VEGYKCSLWFQSRRRICEDSTNVGWVCGLSLGMYKGYQQGMSNPNSWTMIHPKKKVDLPQRTCLLRYIGDALAQVGLHFFETRKMHMFKGL